MSFEPSLELLTTLRRDLHRIPELDFNLPKTIAYVHSVLDSLSCEVSEPTQSCVCAFFDVDKALGRQRSSSIAIRADMDALPIDEKSGVDFCSTHPGQMHACGHDGHMAMALACAMWVDAVLKDSATNPSSCLFNHNILFVFQPAEETTGGAAKVCASGVFEHYNTERIFGFHVWPDLPKGVVATRSGALLARSSETTITIHGSSSHIAKSAEGNDALLAAAHFLTAAEAAFDTLSQQEPCLLKFGHMTSGTVRNAISAESRIEGSLRVFSDDMFKLAKTTIDRCAAVACSGYGCTCDLHFSEGYPPVINDENTTNASCASLEAAGIDVSPIPNPLLIAEDFAFYQQHLPGTFFLLGTGTGIALHSDTFTFDESILLKGVEVYQTLLQMA